MNNYKTKYDEIIVDEELALEALNNIYNDFCYTDYDPNNNQAKDELERIKNGVMRGIIEFRENENTQKWSIIVKLAKNYQWGGKEIEEIELFEPDVDDVSKIKADSELESVIKTLESLVSLKDKNLIRKLSFREFYYLMPCALLLYGMLTPYEKKQKGNYQM